MLGRLLTLLVSLTVTACARPEPIMSQTPVRVLYLSQAVGFVHETVRRPEGGLSPSEVAVREMAQEAGFAVTFSHDARELTPPALAGLDVLMLGTTGALPLDRPAWSAITTWVGAGGGVVGVHSAADTQLAFEGGREAWTDFIGGQFDGHPWTEGTPIRLVNLDPDHPLAAMWPDGADYAEEIYQYSGFRTETVRVLQALDMSDGPLRRPYPVPVTWVKAIGEGRLFYTNLGHTPSTWDDPRFRAQIIAGVRWAAGGTYAESAPNPDVQDQAAITAFAAAEGLAGIPAPADRRAAADAIRALQPFYPDREDTDASAWEAAFSRARRLVIEGPRP